MRGVDEGEEEAHGDRLDTIIAQAAHRATQRGLVERRDCLALEIESLGNLLCQPLRHKERRLLKVSVQQIAALRLRPAPRFVNGSKAPGDQKARADALPFEQ